MRAACQALCPSDAKPWCADPLAGHHGTSQVLERSSCDKAETINDCRGTCCRVTCADAIERNVSESDACDGTTVAYAFMTRNTLPMWELWSAFFATCAAGSAIPIVHTQAAGKQRRDISAQLERFGGALVPESATTMGDPRWSWKMMDMQFALYELADRVRSKVGRCRPKWVHVASENDVPVRLCPDVHRTLAWHPNTSRVTLFRDDGGPYSWFGASYTPLAHTDQWTTLAMDHAVALARDAAALRSKWSKAIEHPTSSWNWGKVHAPTSATAWVGFQSPNLWAAPEEVVTWTELKQRGMRLLTPGLTAVYWDEWPAWSADGDFCNELGPSGARHCPYDNDPSHPVYFETAEQAAAACRRARRRGFSFFRKVVASREAMEALAACMGLGDLAAAPKEWSASPPLQPPPLLPPLPPLPSPPPPMPSPLSPRLPSLPPSVPPALPPSVPLGTASALPSTSMAVVPLLLGCALLIGVLLPWAVTWLVQAEARRGREDRGGAGPSRRPWKDMEVDRRRLKAGEDRGGAGPSRAMRLLLIASDCMHADRGGAGPSRAMSVLQAEGAMDEDDVSDLDGADARDGARGSIGGLLTRLGHGYGRLGRPSAADGVVESSSTVDSAPMPPLSVAVVKPAASPPPQPAASPPPQQMRYSSVRERLRAADVAMREKATAAAMLEIDPVPVPLPVPGGSSEALSAALFDI